ncbi:MAG TPA: hypothetical protein PK886_02990 [Candidatus Paceibacterota bacterium]|nr:hypothetical protein [Candidatus Paceibacterota bacterium]
MLNTHFFRLLLGFIIIILIGIFSLLGISASEKLNASDENRDVVNSQFGI